MKFQILREGFTNKAGSAINDKPPCAEAVADNIEEVREVMARGGRERKAQIVKMPIWTLNIKNIKELEQFLKENGNILIQMKTKADKKMNRITILPESLF